MENLEMQEAFLGYLYDVNYNDDDSSLSQIDKWVKSTKMDRAIFWKQYEMMIKADLIQFVQDEANVRLTPKGTLHSEKMGIVPSEKIAKNRDARKRLMRLMADQLTNKGAKTYIKDLARDAQLTEAECIANMHLLVGMGYARWQVPSEQLVISARVCAKAGSMNAAA